jgi:hypothetical protein
MTRLEERHQHLELLTEATAAGARQESACAVLGLSPRTVQHWQAGARSAWISAPGGTPNRLTS